MAGTKRSRFEYEEDGATAFLEFDVDDAEWMTIWHTEVPEKLQRRGIASVLAKTALEYAREHSLKVDVICPFVKKFIEKHPEYQPLVGK